MYALAKVLLAVIVILCLKMCTPSTFRTHKVFDLMTNHYDRILALDALVSLLDKITANYHIR